MMNEPFGGSPPPDVQRRSPTPSPRAASLGGTQRWVDDVLQASARRFSDYLFPNDSSESESSTPNDSSGQARDQQDCSIRFELIQSSDDDVDSPFVKNGGAGDDKNAEDGDVDAHRASEQSTACSTTSIGPPLTSPQLASLYRVLDLDSDGLVSIEDVVAFVSLHPQSIDGLVGRYCRCRNREASRLLQGVEATMSGSDHLHKHGFVTKQVTAMPCGDDVMVASSYYMSSNSFATAVSPSPVTVSKRPISSQPPQDEAKRGVASVMSSTKAAEGALWWIHQRGLATASLQRFLRFFFSLAYSTSAQVDTPQKVFGHQQDDGDPPPFLSVSHFEQLYHETNRLIEASTNRSNGFARLVLDLQMLQSVKWFFEFLRTFAQGTGRLGACDPDVQSGGAASVPKGVATISPLSMRPMMSCLACVYWTVVSWDVRRGVFDMSLLQRVGEKYLRLKAKSHTARMRQFLRHLSLVSSRDGNVMNLTLTRNVRGPSDDHHYGSPTAASPSGGSPSRRRVENAVTKNPARDNGKHIGVEDSLSLRQLSSRFFQYHDLDNLLFDKDGKGHFGGRKDTSTRKSSEELTAASSSVIDGDTSSSSSEEDCPSTSSAGKYKKKGLQGGPQLDRGDVGSPVHRRKGVPSDYAKGPQRGLISEKQNASWEGSSAATTAASPPHVEPSRRSVSEGAASTQPYNNDENDRRGASASSTTSTLIAEMMTGDGAKETLLERDLVLHNMIEPLPLSMVRSLCASERHWMKRRIMWCIVRAACYGLIAAALIGLTNVAAQSLVLGSSVSVADSVLSSTESARSWISSWFGGSDGQGASTAVGTNTAGAVTAQDTAGSTSFMTYLKYQIAIWTVSMMISVGEIVFLYLDTLQQCFAIARNGGIPLHLDGHHTDSSGGTASEVAMSGGTSEELSPIRTNLSRKRVRYLINAVTRCALQAPFDSITVFGVDVRNRNSSRLRNALRHVITKFRSMAPTFLLRVVASRVLSKFVVPFVATPLLVYWNCVVVRSSLHAARLMVLGCVSVERVTEQILATTFLAPRTLTENNANVSLAFMQPHRTFVSRGCTSAHLRRKLYYVPFHVLRESVMLTLFYAHCVGGKVIHPAVHSFLVHFISCCEFPESALVLRPYGSNAGKSPAVLNKTADERRLRVRETFVDVGGGKGSHMSEYLRTFVKELNTLRREMKRVGPQDTLEWLDIYCRTSPWAEDAEERTAVHRHPLLFSIRHPNRFQSIKIEFMMEALFPQWCGAAAMGPRSHNEPIVVLNGHRTVASTTLFRKMKAAAVVEDVTEDAVMGDDSSPLCTEEDKSPAPKATDAKPLTIEEESTDDGDERSCGPFGSGFTKQHILHFLTIGVVLTVITSTPTTGVIVRQTTVLDCPKHRAFLLHLHRSFSFASKQPHRGWSSSLGAKFLELVALLHRQYWDGHSVLQVANIHRLVFTSLEIE